MAGIRDQTRMGKRRPTLQDVAALANVSRATASLVVRKSPLVGKKTRDAVEAAMTELGYVYNLGAARLRATRSRTVGVVVPNLSNPFFGVLLSGIEQVLEEAGLSTFLANSNESAAKQDVFVQRMREHGVDGLIICPAIDTSSQLVEDAWRWDIPLVQALRKVPGVSGDYAGMDVAGGMREAIDRLLELGHRRIGFVAANLHHSSHYERIEAFQARMALAGIQPAMVTEIESTLAAARAASGALLQSDARPTALICHNDVIGLGLHLGFTDRGIIPGRDISLVGFDSVAEAELVRPELASVSTEPSRVGAVAARLLLRRIQTPKAAIRTEVEPTHFVERGSVGRVPAA